MSLPDDPTVAADQPAPGRATALADRHTVVRRPGREEAQPRAARIRRRRIELALGISVPILLLLGWQFGSKGGVLDERFFPAPTDFWSTGVHLYADGKMEHYLFLSGRRVLEGFFMGVFGGLILGVAVGSSRTVRAALEPVIYALWTIPKLALLPLLLFFFGLGELPVVLLIAVECFFLVLIPTITAIVSVPETYREAAKSFNASRSQMLRKVTIPSSLPQVFVALRLAAGASVLVMVAAEFVDGKDGVGFMIFNSWQLFATNQMYVGIITVAVMGTAWTLAVAGIGRWFLRWQRS